MGEVDAVHGSGRVGEPGLIEPAVSGGAAVLREKLARGEVITPDEWAAALRIGLRAQLPSGAAVIGQGCLACERRFVPGDFLVFARRLEQGHTDVPETATVPMAAGPYVGLVHENCAADESVPWSAFAAADTEAERHETFVGADHADPGDETDFKERVAGEALERFHAAVGRLPEVTSEQNPDAEAPLGGGVVRVPLVDRDAPVHVDVTILDDDDLDRLEHILDGPGDLTGELEDLVSIDEARALVATAREARDVARDVVETQAQLFQALIELAAVAGLAELHRQGKMFVRATFTGDLAGQEATLLIGRGVYAGELAAWADAKTVAAATEGNE